MLRQIIPLEPDRSKAEAETLAAQGRSSWTRSMGGGHRSRGLVDRTGRGAAATVMLLVLTHTVAAQAEPPRARGGATNLESSPAAGLPPPEASQEDPAGALRRASEAMVAVSTNGGWVGIWSTDLSQRFGEAEYEVAKPGEIWVQPPGTPSIGSTLLRAWRVTGDSFYLRAARRAGRALAWGQREAGGWDHRVDVSGLGDDAVRPERVRGHCTFDDDISQGALRFLMELDAELDEAWLTEAVRRGIAHLLEAQYEDGGWPQWFPLRGGYHDHRTFNDGAINSCIAVLLSAHARTGREDCLRAALRGGGYIVASQLDPPQEGWAQQHDEEGRPAPARAFEPVAVCSAVTTRNLATLLRLFEVSGEERFLEPFPAALRWLKESRLEDGRWARFYELGSGRPIFADRDGSVHHDVAELSAERREGYAWFGTWNAPRFLEVFDAPLPELSARSAAHPGFPSRPRGSGPEHRRRWKRAMEEACEGLDEQGRWTRGDRVHAADFVRNARAILDHMEWGMDGD